MPKEATALVEPHGVNARVEDEVAASRPVVIIDVPQIAALERVVAGPFQEPTPPAHPRGRLLTSWSRAGLRPKSAVIASA